MLEKFLSTFNPMQGAKARQCLEMNVRHNGAGLYRRHVLVELKVSSGAKVELRRNGERVLMNPNGSWLDQANITKTGLDYAEFIAAQA